MAYTSINKPSNYFNTVLYTGDGNTGNSITGVNFQPDFVWIKNRGAANSHNLHDVIRGITNRIRTDSTAAEDTTDPFTSFDSDGFTLNSTGGGVNGSTENYVSWNWLAGGSASSNTDGSITSSVSANTTAGFSIVSWTGTGANGTIGHGLGTSPSMIIVKARGAVKDWMVGHNRMGWTKYINLNTSSTESTASTVWQDTSPTSSVFSVGSSSDVNTSSTAMIAYCFAEKKGYSKFGSYDGNSSSNGPFVYLGFKPSYLLIKDYVGTGNEWEIYDNKRIGYNSANYHLNAHNADVEATLSNRIDFLSNGFKLRAGPSGPINTTNFKYLYMAFAESPLVTSTGIPTTAR